MKRGVYAGSFDPITNGHVWMIEQGSQLFDELIVAIGSNPDKKSTFSLEDRLRLIGESMQSFSNVRTDTYENQFLVAYAQSIGAQYILRGIRNSGDFTYEQGMRNINADLGPEVVSVFFMPPREIAEVSSSLVRGLVGPEGWEDVLKRYVPKPVYEEFVRRFGNRNS